MATKFAAVSLLALSARAASGSTITQAPSVTALAAAAQSTYETTSPLALTAYHYDYDDIPYQVNPYAVGRGPQSGYNICNSTTAGDDSECQTLIMNDINDFCLWGSPYADGQIGDVEAAVVAYCTSNDAHGARTFPAGTITGLQWITTSAYIQITGFLNQSGVGLLSNDTGGELDPHGDDDLGNPLGGLVYSTNLPGGDNETYIQAWNWNNFIGNNEFCIKLCFNNVTSPDYCQNKYDLIGCSYNMPSANTEGEYLKCDGDLQDEVGTYTGTDGSTTVWSQPSSLAADYTMPWTPRVPASSNCVTYSSEELFGGAAAVATSASATTSASSAVATSSATDSATTSVTSAASSRSTSSVTASSTATGTSASAAATTSAAASGAAAGVSGAGAMGVLAMGAAALIGGAALVM